MNIFLIKYYKYDADHNLQLSWTSGTCDFSMNDAMIHGRKTITRFNQEEKNRGFYYTFEPMEYAPVAKVNEDNEQ